VAALLTTAATGGASHRFNASLLDRLGFLSGGYSGGGEPLLTVKIRQPSHEFTFGVGMSFIPYPLVLTPVV
jgi:hypothetical protein